MSLLSTVDRVTATTSRYYVVLPKDFEPTYSDLTV
jgi:hypothetical protein